jgi:hypothetical protein
MEHVTKLVTRTGYYARERVRQGETRVPASWLSRATNAEPSGTGET